MQTLTALLLLLGLVFAPAGTFTYVWVAMTDPDDETLRIAKTAGAVGGYFAAAGAVLAIIHAFTAGSLAPVMGLVLMLAVAAFCCSGLTLLQPPRPPEPV